MAWAWSKDPILLEHLQSGDVHSATAELAFNTKRDLWPADEWQVKRQNAKKIRFGLQYGEGAEKRNHRDDTSGHAGCQAADGRGLSMPDACDRHVFTVRTALRGCKAAPAPDAIIDPQWRRGWRHRGSP